MTSSSRRSGIKLNRPFVGIPTFLRAPIETDLDALDADIAVYGVPFDEGSPFLAGSRMGPRSIREHSLRFAASDAGLYDPRPNAPTSHTSSRIAPSRTSATSMCGPPT